MVPQRGQSFGAQKRRRKSLGIASRFALVLLVLVPALLAVVGVGFAGLRSGLNSANSLYEGEIGSR